MAEHKQIEVDGVEVDERLAPLLRLLWSHNIRTWNSCQGDDHPTEDGCYSHAYIAFGDAKWGDEKCQREQRDRFLELTSSLKRKKVTGFPSEGIPRDHGGVWRLDEHGVLRFSSRDIEPIIRALRTSESHATFLAARR